MNIEEVVLKTTTSKFLVIYLFCNLSRQSKNWDYKQNLEYKHVRDY
jgi:hypothetical protein